VGSVVGSIAGSDAVGAGHALLVVVGASGGVGASSLATAVAVRASRADTEVVLLDGCPLGGGLDVVLGGEQESGVRWPDLYRLVGSADGRALLVRLPSVDGVRVLSFGRDGSEPAAEVADAVIAGLVAECAVVVVDASVAGGTVAVAALAVADRVLVVAGDGMGQLAALSVVSGLLAAGSGRVGVEMAVCLRGPSASAGPVARVVETELRWPVLCALEDDRGLVADLVHGVAPGSRASGPTVRTADEILGWVLLDRRGAA
jgi:MinD-like ATPase involved in chromosome partitioning or flagellar assembly